MPALRRLAPSAVALLALLVPGCSLHGRRPAAGAIDVADPDGLLGDGERAALEREAAATIAGVCADWGCPPPAAPIPVRVASGGAHCGAGPEGVTLQYEHVELHDLAHELVHVLAGDSWRMPSEGLATHYTERFAADLGDPAYVPLDQRARAYLALGRAADLSHDGCHDGMDPEAYDQAGSFVGFLLARYGRERVRALYYGPPDGFEAALGAGLDECLRAWRAWLDAAVSDDDERYVRFLEDLRA